MTSSHTILTPKGSDVIQSYTTGARRLTKKPLKIAPPDLLHTYLNLPTETRMTVIFENENISPDILKRQKGLNALVKLKGSGTGRLVTTLLQERAKDKLL